MLKIALKISENKNMLHILFTMNSRITFFWLKLLAATFLFSQVLQTTL